MCSPVFLGDILRRLFWGGISLLLGLVFWILAIVFMILNFFLSPWHRLWRGIGVWNLVLLRFIMRMRNLHDTSRIKTIKEPFDPRTREWEASFRVHRTADGTFNDVHDACMGSAGTRFGRNFPLDQLKVDDEDNLVRPNPREVSWKLLTRDRFRPATTLNLLAAAWIQFQVHDWFNHKRRPDNVPDDYLPDIDVKDESWPTANNPQKVMKIRRTLPDHDRDPNDFPKLPIFRNTETHWWDASQLYSSDPKRAPKLRSKVDGKLQVTKIVGARPGFNPFRLPQEIDPDLPGVDLTGFNDNWWVGLSLFHTLFALEHNAICDRLHEAYPTWDDERLFQTARLINSALIAKIHTVEWTPAILGHPTLLIGLRANWWGILTERLTKALGRVTFLRDFQEEISGIPGSATDHHSAPYYLTEEFVSVYRMHPLVPDEFRIFRHDTDELLSENPLDDVQGNNTRPFMDRHSMENLFYSFGVAYPGAITLNNFPRALQRFQPIKDEAVDQAGKPVTVTGETIDLGTVDIMRDRERAVPRYNQFRRSLLLFPLWPSWWPKLAYRRLVGLPLPTWISSLTKREKEDRKQSVEKLKDLYPDQRLLDLMVGLFAESRPKGFGFSDTAFRIFILMASRRLKSDRFYTEDFRPEVYSALGMQWIEENSLKTVLQRHYPALNVAMAHVPNPFTPWERPNRPSPDPTRDTSVWFYPKPIMAGAIGGLLFGALSYWYGGEPGRQGATWDFQVFSETAVGGGVLGSSIGALCAAFLHLIGDLWSRPRLASSGDTLLQRLGHRWQHTHLTAPGQVAVIIIATLIGLVITRLAGTTPTSALAGFPGFLHGFASLDMLRGTAIGTLVGLIVVAVLLLVRRQIGFSLAGRYVGTWLGRIIIGALSGAFLGGALGAATERLGVLVTALQTGTTHLTYTQGITWVAAVSLLGGLFGLFNWGKFGSLRGVLIGGLIGGLLAMIWEGALGGWDAVTNGGFTWSHLLDYVRTTSEVRYGALVWAIVFTLLCLFSKQVRWLLRGWCWNLWALGKFVFNKPLVIEIPRKNVRDHKTDTTSLTLAKTKKLPALQVATEIPKDERSWRRTRYAMKKIVFPLQRWATTALGGFFGPMQPGLPALFDDSTRPSGSLYTGLPSIDPDPNRALLQAYSRFRWRFYDPPEVPPELEGSPDLGLLATRSPYACYTQRITQGQHAGDFEWDLTDLNLPASKPRKLNEPVYEYHPGLYPLGVRVRFKVDQGKLRAYEIDCTRGTSEQGDKKWYLAKQLALCAVSNHMSLVRHWNWVHLTPTAHLAIATRNHLPDNHPLRRLLWPHVFGTLQSNYFGTMAQMERGGDFEHIFSFTFDGLCRLFEDTHRQYNFGTTDPDQDARVRGIIGAGFDTPMEDNLKKIFDVIHAHTKRFVNLYYPPPPAITNDQCVQAWLTELNDLIPNGTRYSPNTLTRDELSRLLARFIYLVTAQHEMVGSLLWNYQLWTYRQPVRVYENGQREPWDVYQRLVNYNTLLNVKRTALVADYSYLATGLKQEAAARHCFTQFKEDLETLDDDMRQAGLWACWKLYPKDLEAHINA